MYIAVDVTWISFGKYGREHVSTKPKIKYTTKVPQPIRGHILYLLDFSMLFLSNACYTNNTIQNVPEKCIVQLRNSTCSACCEPLSGADVLSRFNASHLH